MQDDVVRFLDSISYEKDRKSLKDIEIENLRKTNEKLVEEKNNIIEQNKKDKEELTAIKNSKIYKLVNKITNITKN